MPTGDAIERVAATRQAALLREATSAPMPGASSAAADTFILLLTVERVGGRPIVLQVVGVEVAARHGQRHDVAWAEARTMTVEQALAQVLLQRVACPDHPNTGPAPPASAPAPAHCPAGLTAREVEVLGLLTQGLTYAAIADRLVISARTVNHHLTAIYRKLDVTSRHAATRWALEHHLT